MTPPPSRYVLDTHSLHWYWTEPSRLGVAALAAFTELEVGIAIGIVPLIVIAELHFLLGKLGRGLTVERILRELDRATSLRLESLTRRHLLAFGELADIPEMHDRFIGAVALVHDAPIISGDRAFQAHPQIRTVW